MNEDPICAGCADPLTVEERDANGDVVDLCAICQRDADDYYFAHWRGHAPEVLR